ncbi:MULTISPECIES: hypothetical protein [Methylobacterium]|nr:MULTISPECIES: hypothetical protein [Methylobacterium]
MTTHPTTERRYCAEMADAWAKREDRRGDGTRDLRRTESRRWPKLGLAAVLGLVAGATLFATEAKGRGTPRSRPTRRD